MADYINEEVRKSLINFLNQFGEETTKELIKELVNKKKVATGNLINSFQFNIKGGITNVVLEFSADDYLKNINDGRKPNSKFPPSAAIRNWCKVKGIDIKYVYPIQSKIAKFGIEPTKILDNVVERKINGYSTKLEEILGRKLDLVIETIFKQSEFKIK